jgi:hypothetical protein
VELDHGVYDRKILVLAESPGVGACLTHTGWHQPSHGEIPNCGSLDTGTNEVEIADVFGSHRGDTGGLVSTTHQQAAGDQLFDGGLSSRSSDLVKAGNLCFCERVVSLQVTGKDAVAHVIRHSINYRQRLNAQRHHHSKDRVPRRFAS